MELWRPAWVSICLSFPGYAVAHVCLWLFDLIFSAADFLLPEHRNCPSLVLCKNIFWHQKSLQKTPKNIFPIKASEILSSSYGKTRLRLLWISEKWPKIRPKLFRSSEKTNINCQKCWKNIPKITIKGYYSDFYGFDAIHVGKTFSIQVLISASLIILRV